MTRSICFVLLFFSLCTTSWAKEKFSITGEEMLDEPLVITLFIDDVNTSVTTIKREFKLINEGQINTEQVQERRILENHISTWNIKIHGKVADKSGDDKYTILLDGHFHYSEEGESISSKKGSHESIQKNINLEFEGGTILKLGEEKVIATHNNQKLKVVIEKNE